MKRLKLFFSNFKRTWLSSLILFTIMTMAFFLLTLSLAQYEFVMEKYNLINKSSFNDNDLYVHVLSEFNQSFKEEKEFIQKIAGYAGVERVDTLYAGYTSVDGESMLYIYSEGIIDLFPKLKKGIWGDGKLNADGSLNAVVGGDYLYGKKINEKMKMDLLGEEFTINVSGIMKHPAYTLRFGRSVDKSSFIADYFYFQDGGIFIAQSETIMNILENNQESFNTSGGGFFVKFNENASQEEINNVKADISQNGSSISIGEIKQNTIKGIKMYNIPSMYLSVFYTLIALICYLSLSVLNIYKRIANNATYYLLGCSKRRLIISVVYQIGYLAVIAGGINLLFANSYDYLYKNKIVDIPLLLFNGNVNILLIGTVLSAFILTSVVCLLILNKKSPIDVIRERTDG